MKHSFGPAVVAVLALSACGSSASSTSNAPDRTTTAATTASASAASGSRSVRQTVSLKCTGSSVTGVSIARVGDDATVTWRGKAPTSADTVGFYVDTFDASGNSGRQLGKKFNQGDWVQFVFDLDSSENVYVPSEGATLSGLKFPGAFRGYPGAFHADGAITRDGVDVGSCK